VRELLLLIEAVLDIALIRASPDGERLSPEMLLLLALVVHDDYEIGAARSDLKHMPEPNVQQPVEFQYYVARNGIHADYKKPRTQDQLQSDINVAHDHLRKLLREKDGITRQLSTARHSLRNANLKIWILILALTGQAAIIGWLIAVLKPILEKL
jgi:hypothetical protein